MLAQHDISTVRWQQPGACTMMPKSWKFGNDGWETSSIPAWKHDFLVGGFNPSEKYESQLG
jgi:hypothetical protein